VLAVGAVSNIFTAPPCLSTAQPVLPRLNFDSSSFTFQAPPLPLEPSQFTTNAYPQPSRYEFIAGQEKAEKTPEQEEMTRKMRSMEQTLKNIQGLSGQKSEVSRWHIWDDLARDFVRQFQYNIDIAPDRNSLSNLKKKPSESFREYAVKWREQASRVKPPMDETEMVSVFLQAQEADYYQNMMSALGKPFAEAIKIGEMVENGLKTGRILSQSAIRATSQAIQGGSGGGANRKKKEEATMATSSVRKPHPSRFHFSERAPQHYYPHQDAAYAMNLQPYTVMNAQPYIRPQQQFHQKRAQFPRNQPPHQAQQNPESPSYQPGARCAYHSGVEGHDTESCWTLKRVVENLIEQKRIVLKDEDIPNVTNNPLPAHNNGPIIGMICEDKEFDPVLKAIIAIADFEKEPKTYAKQEKVDKKSKNPPQNTEKAVKTKIEVVPSKDTVLYVPRGSKKGQVTLSPPRRFELNKGSKMYVPKGTYAERGPIISPRLNEPVIIGRAPQRPMTDPTTVPWNYNKAVVTYKGKEILGEVNETNPTEKYLNLEELNDSTKKRFPLKKPVSAEEAEEFFRKMKTADYEIIDQLRNSPAQVSLWSLLMNSTEHQKVLIKTLNEAYVPIETTVEQLERMAERFFMINQISFSKNDLPPEGAAHNKALHLTVKCEGYYVKRVMLDGGSGVDICPLSTLQRMKIETGRIRPNNVCVRAFDGIKRDTLGEIDLILTIGPVDFEVTFQVLDMNTSYNFLLGRPWIHGTEAIPSTLHQMVKFVHENQDIIVHGEDEHSIYRDSSVPCLEAKKGSEHIVYQVFEVVVADQCEEGIPYPQPFLSKASVMVSKEMIRHGYKLGKGLRASLQGITEPITLPAAEKFFGVGFYAEEADVMWANQRKSNGWVFISANSPSLQNIRQTQVQ
uniref:G-patch domain-containing protein n=1 Tax=Nicotiana tabacum TaxID=4097 RepID=A0A1S3YX47_TOBAC